VNPKTLFCRLAPALLLFLLADAARAQGAGTAIDVHIEGAVKSLTLYLARFVEAGAALVIGVASVQSLGRYFLGFFRGPAADIPKEQIRLALGRSLALALEFELGADILKTAVAPTWNDIGLLAAIAVLRTALNYFLERELRAAEQRDPGVASSAGETPARGA
jgi:uncharacterized membrane protein